MGAAETSELWTACANVTLRPMLDALEGVRGSALSAVEVAEWSNVIVAGLETWLKVTHDQVVVAADAGRDAVHAILRECAK